jgi:hypothetical protein
MEDVIEIGADGTFELDLPPPPKVTSSSKVVDGAGDLDYVTDKKDPLLEDAETNAMNALSIIPPGGYKIYDEHDAKSLSVAIRLRDDDERVKDCRVSGNAIEVTTTDNTVMTVALPHVVDPTTATCTTADTIVIVRITKGE